MIWIALPAAIALLIKIYLIVSKRELASTNTAWYYFIFVFALNNMAELLILTSPGTLSIEMLARAYHPTAIAVLFYCMIYSMGSVKTNADKIISYVAGGYAIILSAAIMASDYVVLGAEPFGISVTAIRGEFYYSFQLYVLAMCGLISYVLFRNFKNSAADEQKMEALWVIYALTPSVLITAASVTLMALGFQINALVLTPIGSTIFLLVTLAAYNKGLGLKDPRDLFYSSEAKLSKEISRIEKEFLAENVSLPEASDAFQKALLGYVSKREMGNVTKIANRVGLKRSSLYQKGVRLGYDWSDDRP